MNKPIPYGDHARVDRKGWTDYETRTYYEGWRAIVAHQLRRLYARGEIKPDEGLKRWAGIPLRKPSNDE